MGPLVAEALATMADTEWPALLVGTSSAWASPLNNHHVIKACY